jgi:hypothetical protein
MANNRGGVTAVGRDPKPSTPASDQLRSAHQTPHAFVADPHASRPYRAQQPQPAIRLTTVRLRHPSGIVSCASAIARAHGGRRRQAEYHSASRLVRDTARVPGSGPSRPE